MHTPKKIVGGTVGWLVVAVLAAGQNSNPPDVTPGITQATQPQIKMAAPAVPDEDANPQKIFGVISNIKTVNDPDAPFHPLTPKEKFKLIREYFSPGTVIGSAFGASLLQATDGTPDYGEGAQGYGKRVGADLGDGFTAEVFVTGVFPTLFHEDPRYFRQGRGSFFSRTLHAVSHILVTQNDAGHRTFNFSELSGNLASSSISNSYYPDGERGWEDVLARAGSKMAGDALQFTLKEFAPDILRKLKRKKRNANPPASAEIPALTKP